MHSADPTPRSPASVLNDPGYKRIVADQQANNVVSLIVFHSGTETYWQTFYDVPDDNKSATWHQVKPVVKTITTFQLV